MKFDRESLEYRQGVQALIVNGNKIFITQEIDWNDDEWGFPGGRVEKNETTEQTLIRELKEELPKNSFEIVKKSEIPIKYDWPDEMIIGDIQSKGWSYRGQIKTQFLVKVNEKEINEYKEDEIKNIKWVKISDLHNYLVFPNQFESTLKVLSEFGLAQKSS